MFYQVKGYSRHFVISLLLVLLLLGQVPAGSQAAPLAQDGCPEAPAGLPDIIERDNFCVYYDRNDTTDAEATTVADHVEAYWDRYVENFGFLPPLITDTKLEVHIVNAGCNGSAFENYIKVNNGCFSNATLLPERMQKVVGHELFHRVQFSYPDPDWYDDCCPNWTTIAWFIEGTARAMEDNAFANIDNWANALADPSSFNSEVNNYLASTNFDITSFDMRYESALWWKYFTEQYGHEIDHDSDGDSEPELGVDAFVALWEATATADDIAAVNNALAALGAGTNFNTAFRCFTIANWTKDLNGTPDGSYNYIDEDETDNPAPYGPLVPHNGGTINVGSSATWSNQTVRRYGVRYYAATPGTTCPVVSATFHKDSGPNAFYHVVTQKGIPAFPVFGTHVEGSGTNWAQSFLNDGITQIVAIVGGQANSAQVDVTMSCAEPVLDIRLPNESAVTHVGPFDSPGKFLAQVLVTNGSPTAPVVAGLTHHDFKARVNGIDAPVIGGGFVQEQYWLAIQAPEQTANGIYDLEVTLEEPGIGISLASDTNPNSVAYDPDNTDQVLVIDRSGSMGESNKMPAARDAAKLYVDITRDNDGLAVVPYHDDVDPSPFDMEIVDQPVRDSAKIYVDTLEPGTTTSIGDGLLEAVNQRSGSPTGNPRCSFVLLSDGMENWPLMWADVEEEVKDTGCPVTAIAFGPASNETLMQDIATETGGPFFYNDVFVSIVPSAATPTDVALDLGGVYEYAQAWAEGRQRLLAEKGQVPFPPVEQTHELLIDDTLSEVVFILDWNQRGVEMELRLVDPDGVIIDPGVLPYTFQDSGSAHLGWRIPNPKTGPWKMLVTQQGGAQMPVPYQVMASGHSNLTLELLLPDRLGTRYFTGNRVPIYAFLTAGAPIPDALVQATVTAPDGSETVVHLFDDGQHDDGRAADGFYANLYTHVNQAEAEKPTGEDVDEPVPQDEGAYRVRVRASHPNFQREALGSFSVLEAEDTNSNGLPDTFEEEYGVVDPTADPDLDELENLNEYWFGTDPNDSDTDGGGENDGSEVLIHFQDPLDPADDQIEAPGFFRTAPDNGAVLLTYDVKDEYDHMLLYRATGPDGPWVLHQAALPLDGFYSDPAPNETTFFYRLMAVDGDDHRSAVLRGEAVTPSLDPVPPEARIIIDGGAPQTSDLNVSLSFVPYEDVGYETPSFDDIVEMLISNDPFFADAAWQPFAQDVPWDLAPTEPSTLARVYVRFRDAAGNESVGTEVGTILYAPSTAIDLISFKAAAGTNEVRLTWQTAAEIDNEGFNLWRSEVADGEYTQINPSLIPAQGNPDTGASYEYTDRDVVKGVTYYYKLEDVDIHGVSTFHGPVSATVSSIRRIYLPLIYLSSPVGSQCDRIEMRGHLMSAGAEAALTALCVKQKEWGLPPDSTGIPLAPEEAGETGSRRGPPPEMVAASTDIQVNAPDLSPPDPDQTTQSETAIAVFGDKVVVGWNDSSEFVLLPNTSFCGYAFSTSGGATFTDGGPILPGPVGPPDFEFDGFAIALSDPDITVDNAGSFYYAALVNVCQFNDPASPSTCFFTDSFIGVWKSVDGGVTFSGPTLVRGTGSDLTQGFFQDKPLITVDNTGGTRSGSIYVSWTEFDPSDNTRILFSRSTNGGLSFDPAVPVTPLNGETDTVVQGSFPEVGPNGEIYVAWEEGWPGFSERSIRIRRSDDGGLTFPGPDEVVSSSVDAIGTIELCGDGLRETLPGSIRSQEFPSIDVDRSGGPFDGNVYAVWNSDPDRDAGPDDADIFFSRSTDGGDSWSPPLVVNDDSTDTDQFFPFVRVTEAGTVAVMWYDRRLNGSEIDVFKAFSADGGQTFGPNVRVTDVSFPVPPINPNFDPLVANCYMAEYNHIATRGATLYLTWGDNRNVLQTPDFPNGRPDPDVFFETEPDPGVLSLVLTPDTDSNEVGTPHTVTATLTDGLGNPVPGRAIEFTVTGANTASGSGTTDAAGQASFTYTGTNEGNDTITAWDDRDGNGVQDPDEPSDTATKTWRPVTAIILVSFTASGQGGQVVLEWETASEIGNEGFNIWRSEAADSEYTRLNASLIPAQGNTDAGASYQFIDSDVVNGVTYYYQLEDVDLHGASTFHGPVSATPSP